MLDFDNSLAVVVGINQYSGGISPLRTAVADASAIAQTLKADHKYTVTTLLNEQAQLSALRTFVQETLPQQLTANSRLILYFAGHGIAQNGDSGPEGYLIPQDAKAGDIRSYLPMVELHDALTELPCRHFLAIFDCCFAGAFRWSSTRAAIVVPQVIHRERFDRFRKEPAWQVLTSASYNQTAMDVMALKDTRELSTQDKSESFCSKHSPFAAALLNALAGAADTSPPAQDGKPAGDGVLTATELYLYLRDTVEPLTENNAQRQTPEICALRKHRQGEFIFLTPDHELNLPPAPDLNKKNNPYLGLNAFGTQDADLYFGRKTLTQELTEFVKAHALTIVLGPSGTGKSSLVRAGLLPALQQDPEQTWHILPIMRPGESPLKALAQTLLSLESGTTQIRQIEALSAALYETPESIIDNVRAWKAANPDKQLLLIIDQFEEVITLCQKERVKQQFLDLLQLATSAENRLGSIVLTLRSDFEPQFLESDLQPNWMDSRFVVPPMSRDDLRQVIEQPALKRVLYFEPPSLIDRLLDEVVQTPGALPLLSFTLSELYLRYLERQDDNRALTEKDYERLGGIAGSLTQRATQEYQQLVQQDSHYKETVRNIMLRMVSLEGGELARRRVPEAELVYASDVENQRVQTVLKAFIEARLLVKGQTAIGEPYVEPAHDALVRGWTQLLRWQRKAREETLLQPPLNLAVAAWRNQQGSLWNKDKRLDLLQSSLTSDKTWLNKAESEFVRKSIWLKRRNKWRLIAGVVTLVVASLSVGIFMSVLSNDARQAKIEAERSEEEAKKGKEEATLKEKAVRASSWASAGQAVEGLMLSLATLQESVEKTDYYDNPTVQDDARKSIRDTVRLAREGNVLLGHEQAVLAIAVATDNRFIVSAGKDRTLKLWDANSGVLIDERTNAHDSAIHDVAISSNGKYIASASNDASVRIWEVVEIDGKLQLLTESKHTMRAHTGTVYAVDFHPTIDQRLLSAGKDKTLRLWDVESGNPILDAPIEGHFSSIRDAAFSRDGAFIVSGSFDNTIKVWDAVTGDRVSRQKMAHKDAVFSVAFDSTGDRIVSASADRSVRIWNWRATTVGELTEDPLRGHDGKVYSAIFSEDDKTIISTGSDRTLRFWDVGTASVISTLPEAHSSLIWDLALSNDSQQLISSSSDSTLRIWDIANDQPLGHPRKSPHTKDILAIAVSPDGKYAASAGEDGQLFLWNAQTQALIREFVWGDSKRAHGAPIQSVAFSPDSTRLVSASNDGKVRFWETTEGNFLGETSPQTDNKSENPYEVYAVAFHPKAPVVASSGRDGVIRLWNSETRASITDWIAHADEKEEPQRILAIAFSPDGRYIASASGDDTIAIWDTETDTENKAPKHQFKHNKDVWTVAFSPNEEEPYLASGSADHTVRLWNVETGKEIGPLPGPAHTNDVVSVAFSTDGKKLASASFDRTIQLWDLRDINNIKRDGPPFVGHTQNVWGVQFLPQAQTIVSGSADLSLRWWPSDWKKWPEIACDRLENHPLFISPNNTVPRDSEIAEIAEDGKSACDANFWQE